jgi:sporulation protein YlmC with PRC-barrel domain
MEAKQNDSSKSAQTDLQMKESARHAYGVNELLDADVKDASGEKIGEVENAVFDLSAGKVTHLVIDYEGSKFADGGTVLLAWSGLDHPSAPGSAGYEKAGQKTDSKKSYSAHSEKSGKHGFDLKDMGLVIASAKLDIAEKFDEDSWRDRTGSDQALASDIMGDDVTRGGEEVGSVNDVLVDVSGSLAFLALEADDDIERSRGMSESARSDDDAPILVAWTNVRVMQEEDRVELTSGAGLLGSNRSAKVRG